MTVTELLVRIDQQLTKRQMTGSTPVEVWIRNDDPDKAPAECDVVNITDATERDGEDRPGRTTLVIAAVRSRA